MNTKKKTRGAGGTVKRTVRLLKDAFSGEETAIDLLKAQHEEVAALFKKIEKTSARAQKTKLFDEMASKLAGHDAIERELFYPACEKAMGMTDLLGEALVEHGIVEFSIYQADQARQGKDFQFKCTVLSEIVEHHVKEEEEEFFPKVEKAIGKDKLVELGARMKERFEESQAEDYRAAVQNNLKQVFAGALKPAKKVKPTAA